MRPIFALQIMRLNSPILSFCTILFHALWLSATVQAYIPATPTNDTQDAIQNGLNVTDVSTLNMLWYGNGETYSYSIGVSYELVGTMSNGVSQGAFVHFSEQDLTNNTTITPWIALVSCDANSTNALQTNIFTLAKDRGAVAGLLYSNYSSACIINREYANPANFDGVFDIFVTQSLSISRQIEERFMNQSVYGDFNAQLLNDSFSDINSTINNGNTTTPGYIFATLRTYNATKPAVPPSTISPSSSNSGRGNSPPQEMASLTTVTLYVIASCVSILFITSRNL